MTLHGPRAVVLEAREVPLGGVRAMNVMRSLPSKDVPTIGAWCFLDRFGPADVRMRVEPHPHIGLQTVTWPLVGEIRHRDTLDSDVVLRRGQLNLMTAGNGIAHSEYSVGEEAGPLDALQLWVVLPDGAATGSPGFEQHLSLPGLALSAERGSDADVTVVMGTYAGVASPATAYTPIVGAEIRLEPGSRVALPLDPAWEHGLVLVDGDARVSAADLNETALSADDVLFLGDSRQSAIVGSDGGALLFLLGGEPFEQDLVMWWNFAARSHDEIALAREDWEAGSDRFGHVVGHGDERVPAPPIPPVQLMPRRRRI
ncbi:Quercetin 2,3-dioxygenase [Microbacterium azadirachtae]|uniref:Quercetin 2,3-dioxygenase n=1 Tax=Microbacterium azadirachtae TaxID=582680 RepID=A0A0F0L1Y7_9MICO|nr:pirin family protein [Microbacterium azadirachtae]KJL26679.1 Quercetin 2,3-dioxygenase [Microbacterium azadirachtae]